MLTPHEPELLTFVGRGLFNTDERLLTLSEAMAHVARIRRAGVAGEAG